MSSNGLKYLYIDGVDWLSRINEGSLKIKHTMTDSVLTFDYIGDPADFTFLTFPKVIAIDDEDSQVFVGYLSRPTPDSYRHWKRDRANFKVSCLSAKQVYRNYPVSMKFKSATISDIFTQLITNNQYLSNDEIGTVLDCPDEVDCAFNKDVSSALEQVADMVLDGNGAMWFVDYNESTGKIRHNLIPKYDNKIADLSYVKHDSIKPLQEIPGDVKNIYRYTSEILFPERMFYDFPFSDPEHFTPMPHIQNKYDTDSMKIHLLLPGNLLNIQLFLLLGQPSTDETDYERLGKYKEVPVALIGDTAKASQAVIVDPYLFLTQKVTSIVPESIENGGQLDTVLNSFQAVLTLEPLPEFPTESQYGYITVYDRNWLLGALINLCLVKEPKEILGYRIYYNRKETIQIPIEDATSIGIYGPGLEEVSETFPDSRWAIAYMEKMLALTKDPPKQGDCTIILWNNGTREYEDNPMPGDVVDFITPRDIYPNCYVQDVEYTYTRNSCQCTLSTRQTPAGQGIINEITRIKNFIASLQTKDGNEYKTVVEITDAVTASESAHGNFYWNMHNLWDAREARFMQWK